MYVFKMTGAALLIISSALFGIHKGYAYTKRIDSLREMKKNLILIEGDLRYNKTPFVQALKKFISRTETEFASFFEKTVKLMDEDLTVVLEDAWEKAALEELVNGSFLCKSDIDRIVRLGYEINGSDNESVINAFQSMIEDFEYKIAEADRDKNEKIKIYRVFGIVFGIFITILIV